MANTLRRRLIRLAFEEPSLRPHLLPLVRGVQAFDMSHRPSRDMVREIEKTPWQEWEWQKLPDDMWSYFKRGVPGTIVVPLRKLTPTRARERGIANANKYMWLAYHGYMDKRKPLSLRDNGDGTYTVLDGNSTYANANANLSGWKNLPGIVEE